MSNVKSPMYNYKEGGGEWLWLFFLFHLKKIKNILHQQHHLYISAKGCFLLLLKKIF